MCSCKKGMNKETRTKLLDKAMTRREFLQFAGSSVLILFGLQNILALVQHTKKVTEAPKPVETAKTSNGFGSRKFGV